MTKQYSSNRYPEEGRDTKHANFAQLSFMRVTENASHIIVIRFVLPKIECAHCLFVVLSSVSVSL